MKRYMVLLTVGLIPSQAFCLNNIAGEWDCIPTVEEKVNVSGKFTLSINSKENEFVRKANVKMPTGMAEIPEIEMNTTEKGKLSVSSNEIKLTPTDAELDVVKGKDLVQGESYNEMKKMLLKEETGKFQLEGGKKLIMYVDNGRQKNTCDRK